MFSEITKILDEMGKRRKKGVNNDSSVGWVLMAQRHHATERSQLFGEGIYVPNQCPGVAIL